MTNKHVIYGNDYAHAPKPQIDQIVLNLHIDPNDLTRNESVTVDLSGENGKWLEHDNPRVDVVLIPVILEGGKYVFKPIRSSQIQCKFWVDFEKIVVVGYPRGWYDKVNNLPIIRIGHLSSPFKVPFGGDPVMVGDVVTHEGMSGGPVMMVLDDPLTEEADGKHGKELGRFYILAGINSGQFRLPEDDERQKTRPNLIHIWFPEVILEIMHSPTQAFQ